jgi:hypothetical protein
MCEQVQTQKPLSPAKLVSGTAIGTHTTNISQIRLIVAPSVVYTSPLFTHCASSSWTLSKFCLARSCGRFLSDRYLCGASPQCLQFHGIGPTPNDRPMTNWLGRRRRPTRGFVDMKQGKIALGRFDLVVWCQAKHSRPRIRSAPGTRPNHAKNSRVHVRRAIFPPAARQGEAAERVVWPTPFREQGCLSGRSGVILVKGKK